MSEPQPACVFFNPNWFSDCAGETLHEHDGKQYCVLHLPSKEKGEEFEKEIQRKLDNNNFNFLNVWFPKEVSFDGRELTASVNFRSATFNAGANFGYIKFPEAAIFSGAIFNVKATFEHATFTGEANFTGATFNAEASFDDTTFLGQASFDEANFNAGANFKEAKFSDAAPVSFNSAKFGTEKLKAKADFYKTSFGANADFYRAEFSDEVRFAGATFDAAATFDVATFGGDAAFGATFKGDVSFWDSAFRAWAFFGGATFLKGAKFTGMRNSDGGFTGTSSAEFQGITVEKPGAISFDTLKLRPYWFMKVDVQCFQFINIEWVWRGTTKELASFVTYDGSSRHRVLSIACQRLATKEESENHYEDASRFRFMALDARRLETWHGFAVWKLSWWYWLASGYGERMLQALVVLLGILFLFALLYQQVGFVRWEPKLPSEPDAVVAKRDDVGAPLQFSRALAYSAGVMMLQKPEPRPATPAAQGLVILETVLGPVQAALLALAIRRKFMR